MTLRLNGSTSGYTEIDAPAVAGSNTLVLPTGAGSANQFLKNGSTAGSLGWSGLVEDSSNRLLVGTSTARSNFYSISALFQVEGASTDTSRNIAQTYGSADVNGPLFTFAKHRSASIGGMTAVASGDEMGQIKFTGSDGTNFIQGAAIRAEVDGTPGTNDMPGRLVFSTTADGASSPTARLTIKNDGSVIWGDVYGDTVGANPRDLHIDQNGLMGYISSVRASKANIQPIESINWLNDLSPVTFNRRKKDSNEHYTEETYAEFEYGLIAEEVETVAPELCFYDLVDGNAELRGVHYSQLITPMLKALQQANARIEALEAEVAALRAQ